MIEILYEWVTTGPGDCPKCAAMAGKVNTEHGWSSGLAPGFHDNCDCILVPTSKLLDPDDILDSEPGIARLLHYTDMTGKKMVTGTYDGLTPVPNSAQPTSPSPNTNSYYFYEWV